MEEAGNGEEMSSVLHFSHSMLGEVLEPQLLATISSTQHLIMIGDHQQLRPLVSCYHLAKDHKLDVSLLER